MEAGKVRESGWPWEKAATYVKMEKRREGGAWKQGRVGRMTMKTPFMESCPGAATVSVAATAPDAACNEPVPCEKGPAITIVMK